MTAGEKKIFNYAHRELNRLKEERDAVIEKSNIYKRKYKDLCGDNDRIHWSVQFGENVRVGFGTVIEKDCKI